MQGFFASKGSAFGDDKDIDVTVAGLGSLKQTPQVLRDHGQSPFVVELLQRFFQGLDIGNNHYAECLGVGKQGLHIGLTDKQAG